MTSCDYENFSQYHYFEKFSFAHQYFKLFAILTLRNLEKINVMHV